jgi:tripartite-type tricarboxylate transporter receptor subunit TctC
VPGIPFATLLGLIGSGGIPKDVADKLYAEVARAIAVPAIRSQLTGMGAEIVGSSPDEFSVLLRSEIKRFGDVIKAAGIAPTE